MISSPPTFPRTAAIFVSCILLISTLWPLPAAGGWRVLPIRLDFDQRTRSGVITLTNDGDERISFAIEATEWSQDDQGKDVYTPTEDLVFFPRMVTLEPKQERVVRAGIRNSAGAKEKTYRLFIREADEPKRTEGTAVAIAIKFGVPIFVKPAKEELRGEIVRTALTDGEARVSVANAGNAHFRINSLQFRGKTASGETAFSQEVNGWYLLAGAARNYAVPIPPELCPQLKTIDFQVNGDRVNLSGKIDVDPNLCSSQ